MSWVATGIAAAGLISSFIGSKKAAQGARGAADDQNRDERLVTAEKIRQLNKQERTMAGDTRARAAGSRVKVDSISVMDVIVEQAREFTHERNINQRVGASKAASALQRGRDVGNAVKYQSYSNLAKGASNIFSILSSSGIGSSGKSTPKAQPGVGGI
jgi:hypothetical protein